MSDPATQQYLERILDEVILRDASDLYLTLGCPPHLRIEGNLFPFHADPLTPEALTKLESALLDEEKMIEFKSNLELNFAINWKNKSRFRINFFRQQQNTGIVIRRIKTIIPQASALGLHPIYTASVMKKRGLILLVGGTGTGKSTSLAAMLDYRNQYGAGHVITVEDPIEFVHEHNRCIFTQREIGIDTYSYSMALKNALRQRADVVVIGEIRDRETMEHALYFSETGHLCIATLHANNTNQAIERIINFFPEELHRQILVTVSQNLEVIISQKIIPNVSNGMTMIAEILPNIGLIRILIEDGKIREIKEAMERNHDKGMQTFDQMLLKAFLDGVITREVAISEADNPSNLKLKITQANKPSL